MNIRKSILMLAVFCLITVAFAPVAQVARADTTLLPMECVTALDRGLTDEATNNTCYNRLDANNLWGLWNQIVNP